MIKKISISASLVLFFAMLCVAADLITGQWAGTVVTPDGDIAVSYNLKTEGDKLTGTLVANGEDHPIFDGKVTGNDISFKITYGNQVIPHEGTVVGDTLKMKIHVQEDVIESKLLRKKQ